MAIFLRDITDAVNIERFEKGVQGFHYDIDQICSWLTKETIEKLNDNERIFLNYLISDGIITIVDGNAAPTGRVKHILGVASGGKRTMESVIEHEKIHIAWDEDEKFKTEYLTKWNNFDDKTKEDLINSFKGYSRDNIDQLIEEWAVREVEKTNNTKN